jgi:hypothetical protein
MQEDLSNNVKGHEYIILKITCYQITTQKDLRNNGRITPYCQTTTQKKCNH